MSVDISKRMAVNSIYSIFLESKDSDDISFHHVLQRVNVLIQDRLAYALFTKNKDGTFSMFYPFLNDPIAAPKISKFYQNEFGRSGESDYKSPHEYLFRILNTNYYLLCIRVIPRGQANNNRFQFVNLTVQDNDEKIRNEIKEKIKKSKNKLLISDTEKEVIIRYVLLKVFSDQESDSEKQTGNDRISENFPKYNEYIRKSISFLDGRKYKQSELDKKTGIEVMRWYQDSCFSKNSIKGLKKIDKSQSDVADFEKKFLGANGALNRAYKKVKSSLHNLLDGNFGDEPKSDSILPPLTNFLFFASRGLYEKEQPRNDHYHYGMNLAIPYGQQEELENYFTCLKNTGQNNFSKKNKRFHDVPFNMSEKIKIIWLEWLDKKFWEELENNGVEKIIEILKADFGSHFRSVVDPVMYNVFVHYPILFENGGLDRIISDADINDGCEDVFFQSLKDENCYDDCLRMIGFYYLIFGMLPKEHRRVFQKDTDIAVYKYTDIALSVVPITLQGVCYGCVAHYASVGDEIKLANDNWQRNYNMFHNIDIRFRRTLRQQMEKLYLNKLAKQVTSIISNIYTPAYLKLYKTGHINQYLNDNVNCYKGFMPFPELKLEIDVKYEQDKIDSKYVMLFRHNGMQVGLKIFIVPQNYFVQFFTKDHLDETKIVETIQSAANIAVASIDFAESRLLS
ncbi:MAG: hypothetical protein OCD00_00730 [Colwellia sp.]